MIKDKVMCCNCEFKGLVDVGEEVCPKCREVGVLAWDGDEQEVELNDITEEQ